MRLRSCVAFLYSSTGCVQDCRFGSRCKLQPFTCFVCGLSSRLQVQAVATSQHCCLSCRVCNRVPPFFGSGTWPAASCTHSSPARCARMLPSTACTPVYWLRWCSGLSSRQLVQVVVMSQHVCVGRRGPQPCVCPLFGCPARAWMLPSTAE